MDMPFFIFVVATLGCGRRKGWYGSGLRVPILAELIPEFDKMSRDPKNAVCFVFIFPSLKLPWVTHWRWLLSCKCMAWQRTGLFSEYSAVWMLFGCVPLLWHCSSWVPLESTRLLQLSVLRFMWECFRGENAVSDWIPLYLLIPL